MVHSGTSQNLSWYLMASHLDSAPSSASRITILKIFMRRLFQKRDGGGCTIGDGTGIGSMPGPCASGTAATGAESLVASYSEQEGLHATWDAFWKAIAASVAKLHGVFA